MSRKDAARRKREQRDRDRKRGLIKVEVWVAADQAQKVREFAGSLPVLASPKDPRQFDLVDRIEAMVGKEQ